MGLPSCVWLPDEEYWKYCCKWNIVEDALQGFLSNSWNIVVQQDKKEPKNLKERLKKSTFNLVSTEPAHLYLPQKVQQKVLSLTSIALEVCDIIS